MRLRPPSLLIFMTQQHVSTQDIATKFKILLSLHTALDSCHPLSMDLRRFMMTLHECLDDHNPNKWAASMKCELSGLQKCMPRHAVYQMFSKYSRRLLQQHIQRLDWLL